MAESPDSQSVSSGPHTDGGAGSADRAAALSAATARDHQAGRLAQAEAGYRQILAIDPSRLDVLLNLGALLSSRRRLDAAIEFYERAIAGHPGSARAHSDFGALLQQQGRIEDAKAAFLRAIELKADFGEPYLHLSILSVADKSATRMERLNEIRDLLTRDSDRLATDERTKLLFGLGRVLEALGDFDRAFETMAEANARVRASSPYDIVQAERHLDSIAEAFDASLLERLRDEGLASERPVFILGMPRSGTTLVEQIISAHPKVRGAGEVTNLINVVAGTRGKDGEVFPAWAKTMTGQDCRMIGQAYLDSLPSRGPGERRLTDKTLRNYENIGLIQAALPHARIIHCRRDPRDMAVSAFAIQFNTGRYAFAYDLADLGRYWRAYERLMAHWDAVLPAGRVLHVPYESVVEDVEGWSRRLIAHCGLEWDDACLRFFESKRAVDTASLSQVRQPIYKGSVGRWRKFERHLGPLLHALGEPYSHTSDS